MMLMTWKDHRYFVTHLSLLSRVSALPRSLYLHLARALRVPRDGLLFPPSSSPILSLLSPGSDGTIIPRLRNSLCRPFCRTRTRFFDGESRRRVQPSVKAFTLVCWVYVRRFMFLLLFPTRLLRFVFVMPWGNFSGRGERCSPQISWREQRKRLEQLRDWEEGKSKEHLWFMLNAKEDVALTLKNSPESTHQKISSDILSPTKTKVPSESAKCSTRQKKTGSQLLCAFCAGAQA